MSDFVSPSRLIVWPGYLAALVLISLPVSVLVVRSGAWQSGLMLYALACVLGTLLLVYFLVLLFVPRFARQRGAVLLRAVLVIVPALLLLSLLPGDNPVPAIHDITTDVADPPLFSAAPGQRPEGSNPLAIKPDVISQQQQAYPDIATLSSPLPPTAAFDRAQQVAEEMGWEIYRRDAGAGELEAVDTTTIMAFRDDIVVRVRDSISGSEIDLRSVSRVGLSDMGKNAERIRDFQARFESID